MSPVAGSRVQSEACPLHLQRPPMARSEMPTTRPVAPDDAAVVAVDVAAEVVVVVGKAGEMALSSCSAGAGKTILMSVAVTQSCSTGLCSKSSALGRSAKVEKAIRVPVGEKKLSNTVRVCVGTTTT